MPVSVEVPRADVSAEVPSTRAPAKAPPTSAEVFPEVMFRDAPASVEIPLGEQMDVEVESVSGAPLVAEEPVAATSEASLAAEATSPVPGRRS